MAKIAIETFGPHHLVEFLALSHAEYGDSPAADVEHIRWKHLESPLGASTYIRLVVDGKTVGRALLQPTVCHTASGCVTTANVTDVLIAREYRSPPTNFIDLTRASEDIPAFSSVYQTSSNRTDRLYRRLFRFPLPFSLRGYGLLVRVSGIVSGLSGRRADVLDRLIWPLRSALGQIAVAAMAVARLEVSARLPDDDALSALISKSVRNSGPMLQRSRSFLKWRLTDAPLFGATVYCVERDGTFLGYVATRKLRVKGLSVLVIVDLLLDQSLTLIGRLALRLWLIRLAMRSDVDALFTMVNPHSRMARIGVGFPLLRIPSRFLPHQTPIFFRSAGKEGRVLETDDSTHLTLADLDYI